MMAVCAFSLPLESKGWQELLTSPGGLHQFAAEMHNWMNKREKKWTQGSAEVQYRVFLTLGEIGATLVAARKSILGRRDSELEKAGETTPLLKRQIEMSALRSDLEGGEIAACLEQIKKLQNKFAKTH